MPWNDNGGNGNSGGPWGGGQPGRGGGGGNRGGGQQPSLEELFRQGQDRFRGIFPPGEGGGWSARGIGLALAILLAIWGASGFYKVEPDEQGVVLRFGKWEATTQPGLQYHLPAPIESVILPKVTKVNRVDIGYRAPSDLLRSATVRDVPEESLMLTGDENIVDIDFAVLWVIKDAGQYLFNIQNPENTVKVAAESAMRQVIGSNDIQFALTAGRQNIEQTTKALVQDILDGYGAGIQIDQIKLQKVDPPAAVIDSFRDVQAAQADRERLRNEAEAYANSIIPQARGEAAQMLQQADAYKQEVVARAQGQASRFKAVLVEFLRAKDVTLRRIYLETMEEVLAGVNKVIVDNPKGGQGVVPYLPLPELQKRTSGDAK